MPHKPYLQLSALLLLLLSDPAAATAQTLTRADSSLVVVVHGFCRTARHMRYLKQAFVDDGYAVMTPTLPTCFKSVDKCASILAETLADEDLGSYRRVHFAGHSMGGLIIRRYLADHEHPNLGPCVLIGTPNQGTDLGKIVDTWLKPLVWVSPAYKSFQPGGAPIPPPLNEPQPVMGAIGGTKSDWLLGWMIEGTNDGRVPLDAVPFPGMRGFLVLPYHHDELPFRPETAAAIIRFFKSGRFDKALTP